MKVASHAVMKYRETKPLPGEITNERVNGATLPVKIEAARRAIAACTDLPELLRFKDQAEGLAAAVRTMKTVGPEMIRAANEMMADAWRKGGELLEVYSRVVPGVPGKRSGTTSPRMGVAKSLGLKRNEAGAMVRLYKATQNDAYKAAGGTKNLFTAAARVPRAREIRWNGITYSEALSSIMTGGPSKKGLATASYCIRQIPLDAFKHLAPDERKVVKAKITEIMELLDEMDRLCK